LAVEQAAAQRVMVSHQRARAGGGLAGLTLVEALATTWGARPSGTGKTVWFTLAIDAAPP
jgi:hypothetical protein